MLVAALPPSPPLAARRLAAASNRFGRAGAARLDRNRATIEPTIPREGVS